MILVTMGLRRVEKSGGGGESSVQDHAGHVGRYKRRVQM